MKKKVLVTQNYFPHYRLPVLRELARDQDIEYVFVSGRETNKQIRLIAEEEYARNGIHWQRVRNLYCLRRRILCQPGLVRRCLSPAVDAVVIQGNPYSLTNWLLLLLFQFIRKPIYIWGHGIIRGQMRDRLKLLFYRMADGVFLYGNWARARLIQLGIDPQRLHIIYNSLDHSAQTAIRESLSLGQLEDLKTKLFENTALPLLCFIGRLTWIKRLDLLVDATRLLHERGLLVNLLLIGDGESRPSLEKQVAGLDLQRYTRFIDETYDEESIAPLISISDVCVSPGDVGLTAMHAMVYGVPVISHDDPYRQMPEFEVILPGRTGALFKRGSAASLADTIDNWLRECASRRGEVRQACIETIAQHYTPENQARILKQVLLASIADGNAREP